MGEGGIQPDKRIDDADGIGPDDAYSSRTGPLDQRPLPSGALRTKFLKSCGDNDCRVHASRGIARDIQPPTPVAATRGIVVVRGPDKGYSYQRHVENVLKEARCTARSF